MMTRPGKRLTKLLPRRLRVSMGAGLAYLQRLGRWPIILHQVRGVSVRDEAALLVSAALAPLVSLRNLNTWQDPELLFDANVRVRGVGFFKLRRRTDDLWHVLPWREAEIHRALRKHLRSGSVFVDAGANIGTYSVMASNLVGEAGKVIAVEMVPATAALLRKHLQMNETRNVQVVESALSNRAGETLTAMVPEGKCGQATIASTGRGRPVQVMTTTLDVLCGDLAKIDLLKMDLEGAEVPALEGARKVLERTQLVIFETAHGGGSTAAKKLEELGFSVVHVDRKDAFAYRKGP